MKKKFRLVREQSFERGTYWFIEESNFGLIWIYRVGTIKFSREEGVDLLHKLRSLDQTHSRTIEDV